MMKQQPKLRMGWFIPTLGDTTAFGVPEKAIPQSLDHFVQVATAAENAGFEYALVPINPYCWDAWVVSSFVAAHTKSLKLLGDRKSNRMSTSIAHVWGVSGMHTGDCWVDFSKPVARDFSV